MTEPTDYSKILETIAACEAFSKLNNFIDNATRKNVPIVRDAAVRRLASLTPNHESGTLEFDFWKTVKTYEIILREDEKTTVNLFKTRKKAETEGIELTLSEWILNKSHGWVFNTLVVMGKPELTGESVVLRHSARFDEAVVEAAAERLNLNSPSMDN